MLLNFTFTLLQSEYPSDSASGLVAGIFGMGFIIFILAISILQIAGMWKAFEKAGQPGWAAIIPFYNMYIMTQIAKKPGWWVLLMFIPLVNLIIIILLSIEFAKQYGKDSGFGLGLAFLGFIFWPILGFGSAQYIGDGLNTEIQNIGNNNHQ